MKANIQIQKTVEAKTLHASLRVRYWEDAEVDGVEDVDGTLIPCRNGDRWEIDIDIDSGVILNWEKGKTAKIHYKVCDEGDYAIYDDSGELIYSFDGYVPTSFSNEGYGDYVIFDIDSDGKISPWMIDLDDFLPTV